MKLTKTRLKQIIKEEISQFHKGYGDINVRQPPSPLEQFEHMSKVLQGVQEIIDSGLKDMQLTPKLETLMVKYINPDGTFNAQSGVEIEVATKELGDAYNELIDIEWDKDYKKKVN